MKKRTVPIKKIYFSSSSSSQTDSDADGKEIPFIGEVRNDKTKGIFNSLTPISSDYSADFNDDEVDWSSNKENKPIIRNDSNSDNKITEITHTLKEPAASDKAKSNRIKKKKINQNDRKDIKPHSESPDEECNKTALTNESSDFENIAVIIQNQPQSQITCPSQQKSSKRIQNTHQNQNSISHPQNNTNDITQPLPTVYGTGIFYYSLSFEIHKNSGNIFKKKKFFLKETNNNRLLLRAKAADRRNYIIFDILSNSTSTLKINRTHEKCILKNEDSEICGIAFTPESVLGKHGRMMNAVIPKKFPYKPQESVTDSLGTYAVAKKREKNPNLFYFNSQRPTLIDGKYQIDFGNRSFIKSSRNLSVLDEAGNIVFEMYKISPNLYHINLCNLLSPSIAFAFAVSIFV